MVYLRKSSASIVYQKKWSLGVVFVDSLSKETISPRVVIIDSSSEESIERGGIHKKELLLRKYS